MLRSRNIKFSYSINSEICDIMMIIIRRDENISEYVLGRGSFNHKIWQL